MAWVATFCSHFGAVCFRRLCRARGVGVELMPVPRSLSSSCGTCARFERDPRTAGEAWAQEVELVVEETGDPAHPYREVFRPQNG